MAKGKTPNFLGNLKKGALHQEMGIAADKKIPKKMIKKAEKSDDKLLAKRAQFADNASKWNKK